MLPSCRWSEPSSCGVRRPRSKLFKVARKPSLGRHERDERSRPEKRRAKEVVDMRRISTAEDAAESVPVAVEKKAAVTVSR